MIIKVRHGTSFRSMLDELHACHPAKYWVCRKSMRYAWSRCDRADWMLWLAIKLGVDDWRIKQAMHDCFGFGDVRLPWCSSYFADDVGHVIDNISYVTSQKLNMTMDAVRQRFADIVRLQIPIEVLAASARKWRACEHRDKLK